MSENGGRRSAEPLFKSLSESESGSGSMGEAGRASCLPGRSLKNEDRSQRAEGIYGKIIYSKIIFQIPFSRMILLSMILLKILPLEFPL